MPSSVASSSTKTPVEMKLRRHSADPAAQKYVHDKCHTKEHPKRQCMLCDETQSKNGESSGTQEANADVRGKGKERADMSEESSGFQEANADIRGKGKETAEMSGEISGSQEVNGKATTDMSRESSQRSGEDMSHGESPATSNTTISSVQGDDTLSEIIQSINESNLPPVSPQAAQMTFSSPEDMKELARTHDLLADIIKQVARDCQELKKHIAGLKDALNMGSTSISGPIKRLDPTSKDFEPGWVPRNGYSMARLRHLNFRLEELIKEARRLETEFNILKKFWEARFIFAETGPVILLLPKRNEEL